MRMKWAPLKWTSIVLKAAAKPKDLKRWRDDDAPPVVVARDSEKDDAKEQDFQVSVGFPR